MAHPLLATHSSQIITLQRADNVLREAVSSFSLSSRYGVLVKSSEVSDKHDASGITEPSRP